MKRISCLFAVLLLFSVLSAGCVSKSGPAESDVPSVLSPAVSEPEETDPPDIPETQPRETEPETEPETEAEPEPETESAPPETTPPPAGPVLLFEDDFDGSELDGKKWARCPEWERGGGACVWDDAYSFLDGKGHLILRAEYDDDDAVIHSGAVRTAGLFSAGYGYYEASVCFPKAEGTWGAFWIMAGDLNRPTAAEGLEIDIIESINNESGLCNHALHWNYPDLHSASSGQMKKDIYDGRFHTFAVDRSEKGYTFYIDGKKTWQAAKTTCEPCPADGYMKLTVEAAEWAGAGSAASFRALPADMLVDYVRVYSEKP